jgi:hypothetical protein
MALQPSGPISFNNINVELNFTGTAQLSLGSAAARGLAGVPSGQISMSNFYGKSNILYSGTVTAGQSTVGPVKGDPYQEYGFIDSSYPTFGGSRDPLASGSISNSTFPVTGSSIIKVAYGVAFVGTFEFVVSGEYPNSGWSTLTIYHNYSGTTTTLNRVDMGYGTIGGTTWSSSSIGNPFANITPGQNTYLITIK